jgi:hypothetical protein
MECSNELLGRESLSIKEATGREGGARLRGD